jgi:hypothetical protein
MEKFIAIVVVLMLVFTMCVACDDTDGTRADTLSTQEAAEHLQSNQPTPTDISYSLERYNLIRRAYWVNGQREKANTLPCEIQKPLGYIVLFSGNTVVGRFVVDGKVSSLNSFLTPDTEYPTLDSINNDWLADIDGSYGENDNGIFFFTTDGKYVEWTGTYLYSDIPFEVDDPVVKMEGNK